VATLQVAIAKSHASSSTLDDGACLGDARIGFEGQVRVHFGRYASLHDPGRLAAEQDRQPACGCGDAVGMCRVAPDSPAHRLVDQMRVGRHTSRLQHQAGAGHEGIEATAPAAARRVRRESVTRTSSAIGIS
jgi:hypothetical protein